MSLAQSIHNDIDMEWNCNHTTTNNNNNSNGAETDSIEHTYPETELHQLLNELTRRS